jgi:UDP-GlcNAc:undecaprenyl-phosphate/decaprenyl-phosphate GlcNAc-1-phosphate transferase
MNLAPAIFLIATAGVLTAFLCFFAKPICTRLGLLDEPGDRKIHKKVTPLMGGVVILAVLVPAGLMLAVSSTLPNKMAVWMAAIFGMTLVGILDDRHSLSPRTRLILSFLIFGIAAFVEPIYNVRILDFQFPPLAMGLGTRGIGIAFTILCCVGLINAVNMADGKNGLVIGLCIAWLALLSLRAPTPYLPFIALLITILTVLLFFNLSGRLFLGDGGAYGFAATVGIMAIAVYNSPGTDVIRAMFAEDLVLLFAVPVFDSFRLTYKRMRRGQSPMAGDRDHFHHHLLDRFGWPNGLMLYWAAAVTPISLKFMLTAAM